MTLRGASGKFSLPKLGRKRDDGPNSGRVASASFSQHSATSAADDFGAPYKEPPMPTSPGGQSSGGAAGGGASFNFGSKLGKSIAHTSLIPALGNQDLRPLQDVITAEKGVMQASEKLAAEFTTSAAKLPAYGQSVGADLQDVLGHSATLLNQMASAFQVFSQHQASLRTCFKRIRQRDEQLDEMRRKRRAVNTKMESAERKLSKMGPENKQLVQQTELLERLRADIRQMDMDIVAEECKLGDFKRQAVKEAMSYKFAGLEELGEKMCIVGEMGKLVIEHIPLEETPPGYGRAPYTSYEQTEKTVSEGVQSIAAVQFNPASSAPKPPGLPAPGDSGSLMGPGIPRGSGDPAQQYNNAGGAAPGAGYPGSMPNSPPFGGAPTLPPIGPGGPTPYYPDAPKSPTMTTTTSLTSPIHSPQTRQGDFGASHQRANNSVDWRNRAQEDANANNVDDHAHDYEYQQQREMDAQREREQSQAQAPSPVQAHSPRQAYSPQQGHSPAGLQAHSPVQNDRDHTPQPSQRYTTEEQEREQAYPQTSDASHGDGAYNAAAAAGIGAAAAAYGASGNYPGSQTHGVDSPTTPTSPTRSANSHLGNGGGGWQPLNVTRTSNERARSSNEHSRGVSSNEHSRGVSLHDGPSYRLHDGPGFTLPEVSGVGSLGSLNINSDAFEPLSDPFRRPSHDSNGHGLQPPAHEFERPDTSNSGYYTPDERDHNPLASVIPPVASQPSDEGHSQLAYAGVGSPESVNNSRLPPPPAPALDPQDFLGATPPDATTPSDNTPPKAPSPPMVAIPAVRDTAAQDNQSGYTPPRGYVPPSGYVPPTGPPGDDLVAPISIERESYYGGSTAYTAPSRDTRASYVRDGQISRSSTGSHFDAHAEHDPMPLVVSIPAVPSQGSAPSSPPTSYTDGAAPAPPPKMASGYNPPLPPPGANGGVVSAAAFRRPFRPRNPDDSPVGGPIGIMSPTDVQENVYRRLPQPPVGIGGPRPAPGHAPSAVSPQALHQPKPQSPVQTGVQPGLPPGAAPHPIPASPPPDYDVESAR